jgi:hypothetical protein
MGLVREEEKEGSLLAKVRAMLVDCEETNLELFKATGLPPGWLDTVKRGVTKDPSVNRIQKLYEYLSKKNLKV